MLGGGCHMRIQAAAEGKAWSEAAQTVVTGVWSRRVGALSPVPSPAFLLRGNAASLA